MIVRISYILIKCLVGVIEDSDFQLTILSALYLNWVSNNHYEFCTVLFHSHKFKRIANKGVSQSYSFLADTAYFFGDKSKYFYMTEPICTEIKTGEQQQRYDLANTTAQQSKKTSTSAISRFAKSLIGKPATNWHTERPYHVEWEDAIEFYCASLFAVNNMTGPVNLVGRMFPYSPGTTSLPVKRNIKLSVTASTSEKLLQLTQSQFSHISAH